ncbi:MAG: flagellar biosynthesis anti-sigma factor FlgM [Planctomycetaceae bacterium]
MEVSGASGVGGSSPVRSIQTTPAQAAPSPGVQGLRSPEDEIAISSAARLLGEIQNDPLVRAERLAEIREAIANGVYETPAKLEAALLKLLEEIRRGGV